MKCYSYYDREWKVHRLQRFSWEGNLVKRQRSCEHISNMWRMGACSSLSRAHRSSLFNSKDKTSIPFNNKNEPFFPFHLFMTSGTIYYIWNFSQKNPVSKFVGFMSRFYKCVCYKLSITVCKWKKSLNSKQFVYLYIHFLLLSE